jgi:hypothetical protein
VTSAAALPDFYTAPPDAEPSAVTAELRRSAVGRRTLLKLAAGGALGIGLAALDLVSRALPARATNPNPVLSVWPDCTTSHWFNASSICYPPTAYYGSVCNGSWHRNDSYSGSSVTYNYTFDNTSCTGRNAWRWTNGTRRKCSDGHTYYQDGSTYRNTFSICRTAI